MSLFGPLPVPARVVRNPRARRVLLKLVRGQGLVVVVPPGVRQDELPGMVHARRDWIERTARRMREQGVHFDPAPAPPERVAFPAFGLEYEVRLAPARAGGRPRVEESPGLLLVRFARDEAQAVDALRGFLKSRARPLLAPMLARTADELGVRYGALRIGLQRTRWGSCSARGTISLNARALFLPAELIRQLLVHELCHRTVPDHSRAFWAEVARHSPDHARLEAELSQAHAHVPAWAQ